MKISRITPYPLRVKLDKPFYASQGWINYRTALLVKVETDEGLGGWGECYGAFPEATARIIEQIVTPQLIGKDPFDNEVIWEHLYLGFRGTKGMLLAAISGIDIALWDIKGKAANLPISKLAGGQYRASVKCYATGMYMTETNDLPAALAKEAGGYASDGFSGVKMKIGLGPNRDVEIVSAVREAIGDEVLLMIDANCAYDARTAINLARRLERLDVYWFEEPVPPTDLQGYLEVKSNVSMYVAGGELEYTRYGFRDFISQRAADIVQPDICWAGGITEGKRIGALCDTWGVRCLPHVWGTPVAIAANLHLIATLAAPYSINDPLEPLIEFDRSPNVLRERLTDVPFSQSRSRIMVPTGPGLGIELDEQRIERIMKDPTMVSVGK